MLVGAALAPPIADFIGVHGTFTRPLAGIVVLVAAGSVGSSLGYWLGEPIRLRLLSRPGHGEVDSMFGAFFSALAMVAVCWFLGIAFARVPSPNVAGLIQRSAILRVLDSIAPRPPGFLAGVQQVIAGVPFPPAFSGLEPIFGSPPPLPASIDSPGIRRAETATVQVKSVGVACNGIVTGTGFPVSGGRILTNAHVVAGTRDTFVIPPGQGGRGFPARVVVFDPNRDVAILFVPGLNLTELPASNGSRGTQGAVIGYPEGGPESVGPAVVDEEVTAEGRDIYNQNLVARDIFVIEALVKPGNSGGPLVSLDGGVVGVVFAASTTSDSRAYVLTDSEVAPDVQAGAARTTPVGTGTQCAV